jgi:hypothetical protein
MNQPIALLPHQEAVQGMEVTQEHLSKLPPKFQVALAHHFP